MRAFILFLLVLLHFSFAFGQKTGILDSILGPEPPEKKLQIAAYGAISYHIFDWQIWPEKRDEVDFERAVLDAT